MEEKNKKRMCWNCEGSIPFYEQTCPYCHASAIPSLGEGIKEQSDGTSEHEEKGNWMAVIMALLMGGSFFFLFGSLLVFFAVDGYLVLRWSDQFWYLYFLISIPMLYLGIKKLMEIPEREMVYQPIRQESFEQNDQETNEEG